MIRLPAVAGRFYSTDVTELTQNIAALAGAPIEEKVRARACLVPHAGYMYSGRVAGAVYARLALPKRYIILGPRHYPQGEPLAILSEGVWQTPLGEARIDSALAAELKRACPLLREDSVAHRTEHSLEVQLPFLQHLAGEFHFVPIALGTIQFSDLSDLGRAIAEAIAAQKEDVLVVASSDMNHYEDDRTTRVKDGKALDKLLALDARGLYNTVRREGITMCGFGPAVTMLTAARQLGATRAELVCYATSGDITGDRDEVVGYAGMVVH
ncbi:MAG TPA: AmmeMemoRadiSam system protein B [Candidatus Acidoferrales bacterium]|nr:AmmeMemoRadiSam system protein B [Candidatus Acidoferrales bacterium]